MATLIRNAFRLLFVVLASSVYYFGIELFKISDDKVILLGNFYFTINTIFFPVLVSMLQSFSFPDGLKHSLIRRVKLDTKAILKRSIWMFALTSISSLPLVLLSDTIKALDVTIRHCFWGVILGFLTYSIYYYTRRFYKLYMLKESLEDEMMKENGES